MIYKAKATRAEATQPAGRRLKAVKALNFSIDDIGWREYRLSRSGLADARHDFPDSFGTCSFTEPIDDLRVCGLL